MVAPIAVSHVEAKWNLLLTLFQPKNMTAMKVASIKGHNSFYGKGSSENIAYEPAIIRPVRAELKFEDNTRCYSDCKIDSEKGHPILGNRFPPFVAGTVINGFHYTHDYSQSQCKGNK